MSALANTRKGALIECGNRVSFSGGDVALCGGLPTSDKICRTSTNHVVEDSCESKSGDKSNSVDVRSIPMIYWSRDVHQSAVCLCVSCLRTEGYIRVEYVVSRRLPTDKVNRQLFIS